MIIKDQPNVPEEENSLTFHQGMVNRMGQSFFKYGPVHKGFPKNVDALKCLEERLAKYRETGNAEWLMDVANFAMIEFMCPRHENYHFRATGSDESPGRVRTDGADAHSRNDGTANG